MGHFVMNAPNLAPMKLERNDIDFKEGIRSVFLWVFSF
jgi:hypothetical protein